MPPSVFREVQIAPASGAKDTNAHGVHHNVGVTTPDGTYYTAFLLDPGQNGALGDASLSGSNAGEFASTGVLMTSPTGNAGSWSEVYRTPPGCYWKGDVVRDTTNNHDVFYVFWPGYQWASWNDYPGHSWNPFPYMYSTRTGQLYRITHNSLQLQSAGVGPTPAHWWQLEAGNGNSNSLQNYKFLGPMFPDGSFVVGKWGYSAAENTPIDGAHPDLPGWLQWCVVAPNLTCGPINQVEFPRGVSWQTNDAGTYGRAPYNYGFATQDGGWIMYGQQDTQWKDFDQADEQSSSSSFLNQYAFLKMISCKFASKNDTAPTLRIIDQVIRDMSITDSVYADAYQMTDVYEDHLHRFHVLCTLSTREPRFRNVHHIIGNDGVPLSPVSAGNGLGGYDQPNIAGQNVVCHMTQDHLNRFYIYQIFNTIRNTFGADGPCNIWVISGTDDDTDGTHWGSVSLFTTTGDGPFYIAGQYAGRAWRNNVRNGNTERNANDRITLYYVDSHYTWTMLELTLAPTGGTNPNPGSGYLDFVGVDPGAPWVYTIATSASYPTARATATSVSDRNTYMYVGQYMTSGNPTVNRGGFRFDTSSLAGKTLLQANLMTAIKTENYSDTDFNMEIVKCAFGGNLPATDLTKGQAIHDAVRDGVKDVDWFNTSGLTNPTTGATNDQRTSPNLDLSHINQAGFTDYGIRSSRDALALAPSGNELVGIKTPEDITLRVYYQDASGGGGVAFFKILAADEDD